jgi:beta-phosphoglucomutase
MTRRPSSNGGGTSRRAGAPLAAIFDVDGTMVDNARYHERAWIELAARRGRPIDGGFYRERLHARTNDVIVRTLFGPGSPEDLIRTVGREKEALYRELFRPVMKETPGLTAFLEALAASGVPCGAASNSPRENVDMVLDGLGIRKFFRVAIDADQGLPGKPAPDVLLAVAGKLGVQPEECIVFEDSASGFAAAGNAGMPYVAVAHGAAEGDLARATGARAVWRDFRSIDPGALRGAASTGA